MNEQRFWSKIDKNGPIPVGRPELGRCWIWTAGTCGGYGHVHQDGKVRLSHRVAYELLKGPLGKSLATHQCDNRLCCNPDHILPGTHASNAREMIARGRRNPAQVGAGIGTSKLTDQAVSTIRNRFATEPATTRLSLANEYGVTSTLIGSILQGKCWKHLPLVPVAVVKNKRVYTGRRLLEGPPKLSARRAEIIAVVESVGGNQSEAARRLGLAQSSVWTAINYNEAMRNARRRYARKKTTEA